jgi:hypothetical protein
MKKEFEGKLAEEMCTLRAGRAPTDLIFGRRRLRKIGNVEKSF